MLWDTRRVAVEIFDKKTDGEIVATMRTLSIKAGAGMIDAVWLGRWAIVTDGVRIFEKKKKAAREEKGRLVGRR